jgi:hypothetical protein
MDPDYNMVHHNFTSSSRCFQLILMTFRIGSIDTTTQGGDTKYSDINGWMLSVGFIITIFGSNFQLIDPRTDQKDLYRIETLSYVNQ